MTGWKMSKRYCPSEKCPIETIDRLSAKYCFQCGDELESINNRFSLGNVLMPVAGVVTGMCVPSLCEYIIDEGMSEAVSENILCWAAFLAFPVAFYSLIVFSPPPESSKRRGEYEIDELPKL